MWCVEGVGVVTQYVHISHMYCMLRSIKCTKYVQLCILPCLFHSTCVCHPSFPVPSLTTSCSVDKYNKAIAMINSDMKVSLQKTIIAKLTISRMHFVFECIYIIMLVYAFKGTSFSN